MARLKEQYVNEIAPALNSKFGYKSVMQIPKLDKVVINVACGEAKDNEKILEAVMKDLGQITGQKAVVCRAKKSVANFKLRQGTPIGCKVTLRGERMYELSIVSSTSLCPVSATSAASTATALTAAATLHAASRSRSSSPRSTLIRSMQSAAWMSALLPPLRPTKRARSC